jgi:hypothetical protein
MFEIVLGRHVHGALPTQTAKTPTNYDRARAIEYATFFCKRVCSDGILMSGAHSNTRTPGALLSEVEPVEDENDCTHFVSSALGRPPTFDHQGTTIQGGGLFLDAAGFLPGGRVYGFLNPEPLVQYLRQSQKISFARIEDGVLSFDRTTPQFFENTAIQVNELRGLVQAQVPADGGKGDFVAYYGSTSKPARHAALLVNDAWGITCHTGSRCGGQPIHDVGISKFIYCRVKAFREDPF